MEDDISLPDLDSVMSDEHESEEIAENDDDNPEDSRNPIVINQDNTDNTMEATINQKIQ